VAFATCDPDQIVGGSGINLLKRAEEFQSKQASIALNLLPPHLGGDRGRFARYQARRGSRGRRHSELDDLVLAQDMHRRYAGPERADIERLGQLDKLNPRRIGSAQEDGHLQPDPGRAALHTILQLLNLPGRLRVHGDVPVVLAN
jgi:hypothetical protein